MVIGGIQQGGGGVEGGGGMAVFVCLIRAPHSHLSLFLCLILLFINRFHSLFSLSLLLIEYSPLHYFNSLVLVYNMYHLA